MESHAEPGVEQSDGKALTGEGFGERLQDSDLVARLSAFLTVPPPIRLGSPRSR
jgi:hypothetical protein